MAMLAIAGLIFLGIHFVPATRLRGQAIGALGEGPYTGLFVVASLATFFFWAWTFEAAPSGERAWYYPDWWPWLKAVILLFAFVLFVGGVSSPNPTAVRQGELLQRPDVGHGIFAVTRHPLMWSFGLWGIAHFISQPNWRGFWFFGIFALVAIGGAYVQERRKARQYGASWERFAARTSFVPFVAALQGRARISLAEIGWWRIALGVVLWAAILHLHPRLFGVSPLPGMG
jgi:uncharacterized membrane protein